MGVEQEVFCDLCGDEIPENEDSDTPRGFDDYTVSVGELAGESDYELYKYLCKDCVKRVYGRLQDFEWEN